MDHTSRDLERSTKYIEWVPVPARWIERRFLVFTALRNPGYILLHLFLFPFLTMTAGFAAGVLLILTGVPSEAVTGAYVLGGLLVASLMAYRLLSFTVFNASGVHIFRFIGCWWWQTDIPWVAFRETARVNLDMGLRTSNGLTPPDTHNPRPVDPDPHAVHVTGRSPAPYAGPVGREVRSTREESPGRTRRGRAAWAGTASAPPTR